MLYDNFRLVGQTISQHYRVDELVHDGFSAVIYRGWHTEIRQAIAIKCLKVSAHLADGKFLENFRHEARLASAASRRHSAFVQIYDYGELPLDGGHSAPYFVMEWVSGRDLRAALTDRLARGVGPYSQREAVALLLPAIEAMAKAHSESPSIVHRDLKPENIQVTEGTSTASVKVLDFGIGKAMQEGERSTRAATRIPGLFTQKYAAPEQFLRGPKGFGFSGPWTDVHALALILVELMTGRPALDGEDLGALMESVTATKRPTPRARGAGARVSDELEAVCAKALALRPADRFQNAGQFLNALRACMQDPAAFSSKHAVRAPQPRSEDGFPTMTDSDWDHAFECVKGVVAFVVLIVCLIRAWDSAVALGWVH